MRLEEDRLACMVVVGALPDGRKEASALEDSYRESNGALTSLAPLLDSIVWFRIREGSGLSLCDALRPG